MARLVCIVFGFLAMVLLQGAAAQTAHVVGDSLGWTVPQGGAAVYTNWANGKTFMVGDTLVFNFETNNHDVLRVERSSFDACTSTNAIGDMINTGPANVTLTSAGEHYYICTIGRHCQFGQKLAITVSGTPGASPPSTTPRPATPTIPTTPSPSSSANPDACAPTPSPVPTGSTTAGSSNPTTAPPPPGSSASNVLASIFASILAITFGLLF